MEKRTVDIGKTISERCPAISMKASPLISFVIFKQKCSMGKLGFIQKELILGLIKAALQRELFKSLWDYLGVIQKLR